MSSGVYKHKKGRKPWNKGLTKETDPRVAANGKAIGKGLIGTIPWNKGLTKETDSRVAAWGKILSEAHLRSPKAQQVSRENVEKATAAAHLLPRTKKQKESARELRQKMGRENKGGNVTVEHHNDLCHGEERPDDINIMSSSGHNSLHANLRVANGTHNFLSGNR